MKTKFSSVLIGFVLFVVLAFPLGARAGFNDVTFSADTLISISDLGINLTILSGAQVAGYVVNSGTLVINMENGSNVTIRSYDNRNLENGGNATFFCSGVGYSYITLTSTTTKTVTVTPGATNVCSPGGGGGGGGLPLPPATPPLTPPASGGEHSQGSIVNDNGTLYTITSENGQIIRRPYTSAGAFQSYGFNGFDIVVPATAQDLALPIGSFIPPQDGRVICSDRAPDKGTCYMITKGQKAGFVSAAVFKGLGFSFKNVFYGDVSFMPTTANIETSQQAHLPGTLINNHGTIQLVTGTGLLGFPTFETFLSWGYDLTMVVNSNSFDTNQSQNIIVQPKQAGQIRLFY